MYLSIKSLNKIKEKAYRLRSLLFYRIAIAIYPIAVYPEKREKKNTKQLRLKGIEGIRILDRAATQGEKSILTARKTKAGKIRKNANTPAASQKAPASV